MLDGFGGLWLFLVVGGFIILGALIAYGVSRNKSRSTAEVARSELGTREVYGKEGAENSPRRDG